MKMLMAFCRDNLKFCYWPGILNLSDFGSFGEIFEFLKFSKMSFLIFLNYGYSLFSDFFIRHLLTRLLEFLIFVFFSLFGVNFECLKFSKIPFLIFFNSNYSFFSKFFLCICKNIMLWPRSGSLMWMSHFVYIQWIRPTEVGWVLSRLVYLQLFFNPLPWFFLLLDSFYLKKRNTFTQAYVDSVIGQLCLSVCLCIFLRHSKIK